MTKNLDYFEAFVWPFCEKDCLFCNEWWYGKRDFHSLKDFQSIIDKNNFSKVVLTGWEPMSNSKLEEYITYWKNKWLVVWLVTAIDSRNYLKKIQWYLEAGLSEIMISLEGPEKIHDLLTKNNWAYRRILEVLYFLEKSQKKYWLKVIIHTNINALNYKFLPKFIEHILVNFSCIFNYHLQMLEPFGSAYKNKNILFKSYSQLIDPIFQEIDFITNNSKIKFWRLPLCLVKPSHHKFISQTPQIYEEHDDQTTLAGYQEFQYQSDKCNICSKSKSCDRFLEYYINEYSDKEIQPFL